MRQRKNPERVPINAIGMRSGAGHGAVGVHGFHLVKPTAAFRQHSLGVFLRLLP